MKKINLMDIERNFDEIALMKRDIESLNEKEEKMTLNEFFNSIKVYNTIFVHNGIIIPFSIVSGKEDTYFVYCASLYLSRGRAQGCSAPPRPAHQPGEGSALGG